MLTDYENKALTPNVGKADRCPSCAGNDWKMVSRGQKQVQKYKVCKRCGYIKKVNR